MVAVSSLAPSSALMLLKPQKPSSIESFINSGVFSAGSSAVSDRILAAFHGNPELTKQFDALLSTQMAAIESGDLAIHEDNARHIALAEVIQSNRGAFPSGAFSIHTELPDGASVTTFFGATTHMSSRQSASFMSAAMKAAEAKIVNAMMDAKL